MDTGKFGNGQVESKEKSDYNNFNKPFQMNVVKSEPTETDIFAKCWSHYRDSSRNENDFLDHSYQEQNEEKSDGKNLNLNPNDLDHSNDDIDNFYDDMVRKTDQEQLSAAICEVCFQSYGNETDFFKSTNYRPECNCQEQTETLFYGEDMTLDVQLSLLDITTEVQCETISEYEVTKEQDSTAATHELSLPPAENANKMKRKFCSDPLENDLMPLSKRINQCKSYSQSLIRMDSFHAHESETDTAEKPFQCKVCSKAFTTSSHVRIHGRVHIEEISFECKVCSNSFSQMVTMKIHERVVHTDGKPVIMFQRFH